MSFKNNNHNTTSTRGGARPGAGNKKGLSRVAEKRKQYPLSILPSIIEPFREKYGRAWSRRIEELIKQDVQN
jgi:hypothetical protein